MRKALVVGINSYSTLGDLSGCVPDAMEIEELLAQNNDGSRNFGVRSLLAQDNASAVTRSALRKNIEELYRSDSEAAIFYFAGHGSVTSAGGSILASDSESPTEGIPLLDIMTYAQESRAKSKMLILDSCFSGNAGDFPFSREMAIIPEGMIVLTASAKNQTAKERRRHGVFSGLLIEALRGAAANLVGDVSPGSIYAFIDESLGPWEQRPIFKANVSSFLSLRTAEAPIGAGNLRRLANLFPEQNYCFPLDPSYEPERYGHEPADTPAPDPEHVAIFNILYSYYSVNLLVPVGAPSLWHAAMNSRAVRLTGLGEHYRDLAARQRI